MMFVAVLHAPSDASVFLPVAVAKPSIPSALQPVYSPVSKSLSSSSATWTAAFWGSVTSMGIPLRREAAMSRNKSLYSL